MQESESPLPSASSSSTASSSSAAPSSSAASSSSAAPRPNSALILVLLLVLAGWLGLRWFRPEMGKEHAAVGRQLAAFVVEPLTGDSPAIPLAESPPPLTLVTFWGPWCPSCRQEFPALAELAAKFPPTTLRWLPVTVAAESPEDLLELRESTSSFLQGAQLAAVDTYWDPEGAGRVAVARAMQADGFPVPTTVALDAQLRIRGLWTGYAPRDILEMEALLGELTPQAVQTH